MSGYSESTTCPECGGDNFERSQDDDDISAFCYDCGYEYHTIKHFASLEEVNEERAEVDLPPLKELRPRKS